MVHIIRSKPHIIGIIAIILIVLGILLLSRPIEAQVGLQTPKDGSAIWFYQLCVDTEAKDIASTIVTLDSKDSSGQTLQVNTVNGYPGYRFHCTASLANIGNTPNHLTTVTVDNPHTTQLLVSAQPDTFQIGKILQPCDTIPAWGTLPSMVSDECMVSIAWDVLILPDASQKIQYGYAIDISLE